MTLLTNIEWVPLDRLNGYPDNPRKGDIAALGDSLVTNDQYEPIVVQKSTMTVLAGNHRVEAARQLGWSEVAAVVLDVDDEHAKRIMLSSNGTAARGGFDDALLAEQLSELAEFDLLDGTGYGQADLDALLATLAEEPPPVIEDKPAPDGSLKQFVVWWDADQIDQAHVWLGIIARETGTADTSETVFQAIRTAAQHLNG